VVEVKTVMVQKRQSPNFNPFEFFFGPRGGPNQDRQQQPREQEYRSQGMGSGVVVRKDRDTYYILTNNHVVDGATEIKVLSYAGKDYAGTLVGKDARRDLAVVSIKTGDSFPVAVLGNSDDVRVGDWAIAVGNPLGEQFAFSVTMGIVSAVGRTGGPAGNINDFIQTDAPINQGNSGGPLVNIRGEVIGINTWIASSTGMSAGLGFAIPINNAKSPIDEFISSGSISDGWLGVSLVDLDRETLDAMGLGGKKGAFASQVFIGSPADKGGIQPGDFITAVDGNEIRDMTQLTRVVGNIRPGVTATFTLIRGNQPMDVKVKIEKRTDEVAADNKKLWPGVIVMPLTDTIRETMEIDKGAKGLLVANVLPESPAAIVGLQRGDLINSINDMPVYDMNQFYKALRENATKELRFGFVRSGTELESLKFQR
jgi:Do/DeqQ family serine protease